LTIFLARWMEKNLKELRSGTRKRRKNQEASNQLGRIKSTLSTKTATS
jgi:hypothetical protein